MIEHCICIGIGFLIGGVFGSVAMAVVSANAVAKEIAKVKRDCERLIEVKIHHDND